MSDGVLLTRTGETWPDWATRFAADLAERARDAEQMRSLQPETIQAALDAGFFGMVAPAGTGGQGANFSEFMDVVRRLGKGCASAAWTLSFLSLHAWMLAKFRAEAQDQFFKNGHMPLAPAPLAPTGKAEPIEQGYLVSGRWEWATGVNHADWLVVNAIDSQTGEPRFCVLPIAEATVEDVWHVSGMCATGSNAVALRDVFVPEYMTLPAREIAAGCSPGETLHPGSTLDYPFRAGLAIVAATPALGAAEAALEWYTERMKTKLQAFGAGARQGEQPTTHLRLAEALADVRAARLVWEEAGQMIERTRGAHDDEASIHAQVALRLAAAQIVRLANRAIDTLAAAAGASACLLSSPLQRHLRDVQVIRGHVMFDWDRTCALAGKVELGLPTTPTDLI
ncbi:acyl-CoA dehydrogenase family protein [Sphingopyxis sp. 550A]